MYRSKGNTKLISNCCSQSQDVACTRKFNPPLLSTPSEFCAEVLAKGLPVPDCMLTKTKKLTIEKESPPLAKQATARHIKNWQRWCYIWRQTYNAITAKRNLECRPPIMASGESYLLKKEDQELFHRTVHAYHLNGFYIKNEFQPDSIRPVPCGDDVEIKEVITDSYLRDFAEMKRHRYPTHVRNEVSIPPRKIPTMDAESSASGTFGKNNSGQNTFNYEDNWAKAKHIHKMKDILACDFGLYGKVDPFEADLIIKPELIRPESPGSKRNSDSKKGKNDFAVPQFTFTTEGDGDSANGNSASQALSQDERNKRKSVYSEFHGPILKIRSEASDISLSYSKSASSTEPAPHLNRDSVEASTSDEQYFYDENYHFTVTSSCKDIKFVKLKNEGTTSIRYQWFRNPPNKEEVKMLEDPTHHKSLKIALEGETSNQVQESGAEGKSTDSQSKSERKTSLEFHFSELPGIILPGQSREFPIIFRSKEPGNFQETLYLLTHPKIITQEGKQYAVRLTGICNVDIGGPEIAEAEALKGYIEAKSLEEEATDLVDTIIDRALWDAVHSSPPETASKAGIQDLYDLLIAARTGPKPCSPNLENADPDAEVETILEELNQCTLSLTEPRWFGERSMERHKYSICLTDVVSTVDGILRQFDRPTTTVTKQKNPPPSIQSQHKLITDNEEE